MKILDRLPYSAEHRTIMVRGEPVQVRPYQIVVWVSVNIARLREWDPRTPAFPAILDPGNNFNFSVRQSQVVRWAGIRPELLKFLGRIKEGGKHYPRHAADVWLHRNKRGSQDLRPDRAPYRLVLRRGLARWSAAAACGLSAELAGIAWGHTTRIIAHKLDIRSPTRCRVEESAAMKSRKKVKCEFCGVKYGARLMRCPSCETPNTVHLKHGVSGADRVVGIILAAIGAVLLIPAIWLLSLGLPGWKLWLIWLIPLGMLANGILMIAGFHPRDWWGSDR
jgi:hypothetical protein